MKNCCEQAFAVLPNTEAELFRREFRASALTGVAGCRRCRRRGGIHGIWAHGLWCLRRLTFELRRDQRQDARPGPVKMYSVPPGRAWWLAVGPRLERGVRPHWFDARASQHFPRIATTRKARQRRARRWRFRGGQGESLRIRVRFEDYTA